MDLQTALPLVLSPAQGRGALWRPKFVSLKRCICHGRHPLKARVKLLLVHYNGALAKCRVQTCSVKAVAQRARHLSCMKAVAREARRLSCMRAGASPGPADGRADHDCEIEACPGRPERSILPPGSQEDLPGHRVRQVDPLPLCSAHDILAYHDYHQEVKKTYLAIVCGR